MTLVLVTGGTGRAGRPVVQRLHDAGRELRVLSHTRHPHRRRRLRPGPTW